MMVQRFLVPLSQFNQEDPNVIVLKLAFTTTPKDACIPHLHGRARPLDGMGKYVAREVDTTTLPGGRQNLGDRGLDAFMGIGDDQLDAVVRVGSACAGTPSKWALPRKSRPSCQALRVGRPH
jgi:hypothetical protein